MPHGHSANRLFVRLVSVGLIVATIQPQLGCRAIGRFGESRQSIAARRLSRLGLQAMHEGQWGSAETLFSEALDVSSGDERAHAGLAESLWQRGQRDAAVRHLEEAVRLSAGDPRHVLRLGRMYLELGRHAEANRQSLVALQAERSSAEAWTLQGDCLFVSGRNDDALAAYHRALALNPGSEHAQLQAAEIYHALGRHDRLLATLDRLQEAQGVEQSPARLDMLRGIAMRQLGRPGEAGRCFARAATKKPRDPVPHLQLASLALEQGDVSDARSSLDTALQLDPDSLSDPRGIDADALHRLQAGPTMVAGQETDVEPDRTPVRR